MKILHIGDIHLGCTLENFRRNREIGAVFQYLVSLVKDKGIETALLAGDIFDSGVPSNESQELYYGFLVDLQQSGCRQVIVISGNHDNPNFLDAPRGLLRRMNIHVIGNAVPDDPAREVIPIGTPEAPAGFVCAVPYLRPRDVRQYSSEGESGDEQSEAVNRGIEEHYRQVFAIANERRGKRAIPIIGMGHLYAQGSSFNSGSSQLPVGNLDPVNLAQCASGFAYMALGHLHKPQTVAGHGNWRYAGSILPMDLRENPVSPQVVILDTADIEHPELCELPSSCFHRMCVVKGDLPQLREQIGKLCAEGTPVWIKPVYTGAEVLPNWLIDLKQEFRELPGQLVLPEVRRAAASAPAAETADDRRSSLAELTPEEVFLAYLDKNGGVTDAEQRGNLLELFRSSLRKVDDPVRQRETNGVSGNTGVMQFKRLFIRNINSLYGDNMIDFTAPEFKSGIFLISGNTGSGKSSILDAICLALYGCTPRIPAISSSRNSVMSEGTQEMLAELTFSLGGDEYRASFRHQRTRHAAIPFKTPEHRLFKNGREIPALPRQGIAPEILKLIGMNAEQFARCVLLAQGSFDAFLKAKTSDRSDILKSITGTELYTQIGTQINRDYGEVKNEYAAAGAALDGIHFLSDDELKAAQEVLAQTRTELETIEAELKRSESYETLFLNIEQSRKNLQSAMASATLAQKTQADAAEKRKELAASERALNCQESYLKFQAVLKDSDTLKKAIEEMTGRQTVLKEQKDAAQKEHSRIETQLSELLQKQSTETKIFQQVRALDAQIAEQQKQTGAARLELSAAQKRKKTAEEIFAAAETRWQACRKNSAAAQEYLQDHAPDEELAGKAESWELRRAALVKEELANGAMEKEIGALAADIQKNERAIETLTQQHQQTLTAMETTRNALENSRKQRDELLDGKTSQEIQMAWAAAHRLEDFFKDAVQRRQYLSPGRPCPLCGSTEHPYCEATQIPEDTSFSDAAKALKKRLDAIADCEKRIAQSEAELNAFNLRAAKETITLDAARTQQKTDAALRQNKQADWENARRKTAEAAASLADEFWRLLQIRWNDHSALPPELPQRIQDFAAAKQVLDSLAEERKQYEAAANAFAAVSAQNIESVNEKQRIAESLSETLENSRRQRRELFGEKSVADEENRWLTAVTQCRQQRDQAAADAVRTQEALLHNDSELQKAQSKGIQLQSAFAAAQKVLTETFQRYNFASAEDFSAARRDVPYIQSLSCELQEIDENVKTALAAAAERQKLADELSAQLPPGLDRVQNTEKTGQLKKSKEETQSRFAEAEHALRSDQEARKEHQAAQEKLQQLRHRLNQWKFLDDHFGSTASSDRFGRIAQGYTFRELLHYANGNRLQLLQNHFTLICDDDDPLELNVIDHYRGDQVRTSRNLSGGESFEVSLALALGLAEMSAMSQNARLGNVLLDEGFGTLDDRALESALELLMQLKSSDHKLVGVISHVAKLKEKIAAQIEVSASCGMGSLSGAGVVASKEIPAFLQQYGEIAAAVRRKKKTGTD